VLRSSVFGIASATPLLLLCLVLAMPALAGNDLQSTDDGYTAGSGSVSLSYQNIVVDSFNTSVSDVDIGEVLTHILYLEFSYALTDRWQLSAGLPYINNRYNGPGRHDPLMLVPPRPEVPYIDDGKFHSDFQDYFVGVSYLWIHSPVIVEPFAHLTIPSRDYPHFGNAAVGQNLWKAEFGVDLTKFMPFSNWFYRFGTSYTFVEKTLGVSVNHFRFDGEAGYFFTDAISANLFVQTRLGRGDDATAFPPSSRTDERWYQHDRTTRHNYANMGVGADWFFHENYQLSGSVFTTLWGKSVQLVDLAWAMEITRYF